MRSVETGGGNPMEERYIRELDPKEEDPGVQVVADYILRLFPNAKVREIQRDVRSKPRREKVDRVIYFDNEPAIALRATTEIKPKARDQIKTEYQQDPFVGTPDAEHDLPKAVVYLDPTEVDSLLKDGEHDQHPKIAEGVLNGLKLSLMYDLSRTSHKPEKEKIAKWLAYVEAKQQEIKTNEKGKPEPMTQH